MTVKYNTTVLFLCHEENVVRRWPNRGEDLAVVRLREDLHGFHLKVKSEELEACTSSGRACGAENLEGQGKQE